jgi:hypothetical protein
MRRNGEPSGAGREPLFPPLEGSLADGAEQADRLASQTQFLYMGAVYAALSRRQDSTLSEGVRPVRHFEGAECKCPVGRFIFIEFYVSLFLVYSITADKGTLHMHPVFAILSFALFFRHHQSSS